MPAVQLGALLALALSASTHERVASANEVAEAGRPPVSAVLGAAPPAGSMVMGALPPPPGKVVLKTKTYGTVTVDHAAHLARRTACRSCHGDGPVSKIDFTPRQAHETCRACHADLRRGPTDCRGCHAIAPKPDPVTAAAGAEPPAGAPAGRGEAGPGAAPVAALAAALPAGGVALTARAPSSASPVAAAPSTAALPPPPPPVFPGDLDDEGESEVAPFRRSVEAGMVVLGGPDQSALVGPTVRLLTRRGRAVMVHSLETVGGIRSGRTMLMIGGGTALPVRSRMDLLVVGVGGIDATGGNAWLLPAAGLRVGLQWSRALPHVDTLSMTVSGVSDLLRRRDSSGERVGDVTFSFGISAGFGFGRDR